MKWKSLEEIGWGVVEPEKPLFPQYTDKELRIGKYANKGGNGAKYENKSIRQLRRA